MENGFTYVSLRKLRLWRSRLDGSQHFNSLIVSTVVGLRSWSPRKTREKSGCFQCKETRRGLEDLRLVSADAAARKQVNLRRGVGVGSGPGLRMGNFLARVLNGHFDLHSRT